MPALVLEEFATLPLPFPVRLLTETNDSKKWSTLPLPFPVRLRTETKNSKKWSRLPLLVPVRLQGRPAKQLVEVVNNGGIEVDESDHDNLQVSRVRLMSEGPPCEWTKAAHDEVSRKIVCV